MKEEYDLSKMKVIPKGRFDLKRRIGNKVIILESDVAKAFQDDGSVNEALRLLVKVSNHSHYPHANRAP